MRCFKELFIHVSVSRHRKEAESARSAPSMFTIFLLSKTENAPAYKEAESEYFHPDRLLYCPLNRADGPLCAPSMPAEMFALFLYWILSPLNNVFSTCLASLASSVLWPDLDFHSRRKNRQLSRPSLFLNNAWYLLYLLLQQLIQAFEVSNPILTESIFQFKSTYVRFRPRKKRKHIPII